MTSEQKSIRQGFGEALLREAKSNPKVIALCADLIESLRLQNFVEELPGQYVETGVAEQNMLGIAAGLALSGKIPFATSFAAFNPGRNWEQLRVSVAYTHANVKIIGSHAGISVGPDGATHQALEDIAITRVLPNLVVIAPCDYYQIQKVVAAAITYNGPVYIRFGRDEIPVITKPDSPFTIGEAYVLKEGSSISVLATGESVYAALEASSLLVSSGIDCEVIACPTIKPLDRQTIVTSLKKTGCAITVEDGQSAGGFGSAVCELASQYCPVPVWRVGIQDKFGQSGSADKLREVYGIDAYHIASKIRKLVRTTSKLPHPHLT